MKTLALAWAACALAWIAMGGPAADNPVGPLVFALGWTAWDGLTTLTGRYWQRRLDPLGLWRGLTLEETKS